MKGSFDILFKELLTTVNAEVLLQMMLIFEGFATLCAFEFAVTSPFV